MEPNNPAFWSLADKMRVQGHLSVVELVKEAKEQGIKVDFDDIKNLIPRAGKPIHPAHVTDFIISYLKYRDHNSVLDCWAGRNVSMI